MYLPVMMNDVDGDSISSDLTFTGIVQPAHGSLSISGTGLTYTPDA